MAWIRRVLGAFLTRDRPLSEWFFVTFDDQQVLLDVRPPGREPWSAAILWSEVNRICFVGEGLDASDGIYLYVNYREESFVVPVEASGGEAFVEELISRDYFASEAFVAALSSPYGMFCWPDDVTSAN